MYFYTVFAVALALGRRTFMPVLIAWAVATVIFNLAFGASPNPWLNLIANPICCEFLLGIVAGLAAIRGNYGKPYAWLATGLVLFAAEAPFGFSVGWWRVLQAVPLAFVLFGAVGLEQHARIAVPGFLSKWGDASYATYLWHVPVLAILGLAAARVFHAPASRPAEIAVLALGFIVVQTVAIGVYHYIESPLTRSLRRAILKRGPMIAALKEA
jgi:peptidoglycan/LPS O-acetylase OafA/YrhL